MSAKYYKICKRKMVIIAINHKSYKYPKLLRIRKYKHYAELYENGKWRISYYDHNTLENLYKEISETEVFLEML